MPYGLTHLPRPISDGTSAGPKRFEVTKTSVVPVVAGGVLVEEG